MARASPVLLEVDRLSVVFRSRGRLVEAVRQLSFRVDAGETVALVGESGSGKSVTALSLLRLVEREGGDVAGAARFLREDGETVDLLAIDETAMRGLRGNAIAMVFQEPMTSLNPVLTVGDQLAEVFVWHAGLAPAAARRRAVALLDRVRLADPERRMRQYPHELSGGMRQRVMIAMALACRPRLLVADEPTTALDVTVQAEILDLLREYQAETGMAIVFITHDMGIVADLADRVVVLRQGETVEEAPTGALLTAPRAAYSRMLVAAVPRLGAGSPPPPEPGARVLDVDRLVARFPIRKGPLRRTVANVHAVESVSFHLEAGETLGLVGESGCGKSTVARAIVRLVEPLAGRISLAGRDIAGLGRDALRRARRDMQMIFQDPFASLDPRMPAWEVVTEPLAIHDDLSRAARRAEAALLLGRVGLSPDHLDLYPHQFSGGQRQRLCIARALSIRPKLIIADEPLSALDVSIAARVAELMRELQRRDGIAYLFISHDLAIVERLSHRVAVMHAGVIVETGPTGAVLRDPRHPYTRRLLAAVPGNRAGRRAPSEDRAAELRTPIHPVGFDPPEQPLLEVATGHFVRAG